MIGFLKINIGNNRIYGLDMLRCIAILFVVFAHGNLFFSDSIAIKLDYLVFDGVSIFFVLSGYLIGGIMLNEFEEKNLTTESLFNFWKRRWFRTIPNYILVLTILTLLSYFFSNDFDEINVFPYYFFLQNLFYPHPNWFPEAWSLSVEEWFYLIIPIIILIFNRIFNFQTKKSILVTAFIVILSITLIRYFKHLEINLLNTKDWHLHFKKQVFTRLDAIMYGVVGAYVANYYYIIWKKYRKLMFVIGLILLISNRSLINSDLNSLHTCVFVFTLNSIGALLLIPFLSEIKSGNGIAYKSITYISLISYSMYLINLTLVKNWIISNLGIEFTNSYVSLLLKYFLFWFFTIILSILIYKYFEIPTTKMRENR